MAKKINKKMKFSEIIQKYPQVVEILFEEGMHCIGCPMSAQESLEEGCLAHGLDVDKIVKKLNEGLEKK